MRFTFLFMHTYCLKLSFLLFALLLLTGCNNDIFIDDTPPSSSDFEIAIGEGKEVTFATDYLRSIQLQLDRFSYDWTTYNEYGYTQTYNDYTRLYLMDVSSSLPFISRVEAVSNDLTVEFVQEKLGKIKISSLKNISGENVSGRIKLEYSYKTEYVSFTIMREEEEGHYIITALTYEPDISNDFRTTTSNRITINNRGPNTITQSYCVENICQIYVRFETPSLRNFDIDTDSEFPLVEIPTYIQTAETEMVTGKFNGEKVRYSEELSYIKPLDSTSVNGLSFSAVYPVEIPPMSAAISNMTISRIIMTAKGSLRISNPISGRSHDLPTTVTVIQPFFYTFNWKISPLDE